MRSAGVVEVRERVAEARAEVEERGCGATRDPREAVRGPGGHALEEAQDSADLMDVVEGRDEVHLRGARVHEARRHVVSSQRT